MKFTIAQSDLAGLTDRVCAITDGRVIPILGSVLIEATDSLRLTATDMDKMLSGAGKAEIARRGSLCVDAARLRDFAASVNPGAQIEGTVSENNLILRAGRARAVLGILPADDFPRFDTAGRLTHHFEMPGADLSRLLDGTAWAAETNDARYYLCGVRLEFGDDLRTIATNAHVLSARVAETPRESAGSLHITIPNAAVKHAASLASHAETCRVSLGEELLQVEANGYRLVTKLSDGTFPDWRRVIPEYSETPAVIERASFIRAAKMVARAAEAQKKSRCIKIEFQQSSALFDGDSDNCAFHDEVDASYSGDPITWGANASYIAAALESLNGDAVEVHISNPLVPVLFCNEGDRREFAIVVPMRI